MEPDRDGLLTWRFAGAELDGRWGWRNLDGEHLDELHAYLAKAERDMMHKLLREKTIKPIPVDHICREAAQRLLDVDADDHEMLWELRIATHQKRRVWGIVCAALSFTALVGPRPHGVPEGSATWHSPRLRGAVSAILGPGC